MDGWKTMLQVNGKCIKRVEVNTNINDVIPKIVEKDMKACNDSVVHVIDAVFITQLVLKSNNTYTQNVKIEEHATSQALAVKLSWKWTQNISFVILYSML